MATTRVTVSMPEELAAKVRDAAGSRSVSAWIADVLAQKLDEDDWQRQWDEFIAEVGLTEEDLRRGAEELDKFNSQDKRDAA